MSRTFITTEIIYAAQAQRPQGGNLYVGANALVTDEAQELSGKFGFTLVYAEPPTKNFTGAGYVLGFDECRSERSCSTAPASPAQPETSSAAKSEGTCSAASTDSQISNSLQNVAPDLSQDEIEAVISAVQIVLQTIEND